MRPYSKETQTGVKAGTKEAAALLQRAFGRKQKNRQSKYKNEITPSGNRMYDSRTESEYADFLEWKRQAGYLKEVRAQVCLKLIVNGQEVCRYFMDFVTISPEGQWELHEVKGFPTPEWRKKWQLTKALLPYGQIPGIPKDARLLLVKKTKKGWSIEPEILDYQ
jgi:hypothetical protein